MRGVAFHFSIPRYLSGRSFGRLAEGVLFGGASGLKLVDLPRAELPGPHWARLELIACGVCGTDVSTLAFDTSPALEPFASFPAVLGHEMLARVVEVGPEVTRVRPGQRVVVDPMIPCVARGFEVPCPSCAVGLSGTCSRAGQEGKTRVLGRPLAPGLCMGFHRDLPGGFCEGTFAHEGQLFPVDDALPDDAAVLIEPLSIAVHAVLGARPPEGARVLVVGSGPIALATIWALKALGHQGPVVAQTKRAPEAELARKVGASEVISPGEAARAALLATGAAPHKPIIGPEVYSGGGFDAVFDCVGSAESLDQALRFAAARGRIVLLGCAAKVSQLDLTPVWSRELELRGFVGYGRERWGGRELHTFEITHELMLRGVAPVSLVTHRFPLERYSEALSAVWNRAKTGAIKVLLVPKSG